MVSDQRGNLLTAVPQVYLKFSSVALLASARPLGLELGQGWRAATSSQPPHKVRLSPAGRANMADAQQFVGTLAQHLGHRTVSHLGTSARPAPTTWATCTADDNAATIGERALPLPATTRGAGCGRAVTHGRDPPVSRACTHRSPPSDPSGFLFCWRVKSTRQPRRSPLPGVDRPVIERRTPDVHDVADHLVMSALQLVGVLPELSA